METARSPGMLYSRQIGSCKRKWRSGAFRLMIWLLISMLLGTTTDRPSMVTRWTARQVCSTTFPVIPVEVTSQSPMAKECSALSAMPEKMSESVRCMAKPIIAASTPEVASSPPRD